MAAIKFLTTILILPLLLISLFFTSNAQASDGIVRAANTICAGADSNNRYLNMMMRYAHYSKGASGIGCMPVYREAYSLGVYMMIPSRDIRNFAGEIYDISESRQGDEPIARLTHAPGTKIFFHITPISRGQKHELIVARKGVGRGVDPGAEALLAYRTISVPGLLIGTAMESILDTVLLGNLGSVLGIGVGPKSPEGKLGGLINYVVSESVGLSDTAYSNWLSDVENILSASSRLGSPQVGYAMNLIKNIRFAVGQLLSPPERWAEKRGNLSWIPINN